MNVFFVGTFDFILFFLKLNVLDFCNWSMMLATC